ncbi:TetR family transcriptional regulator [Glutamicibacter sp. JL.03c]|uniref:TetR family transcriptional regulator n=1 Tax=Glutamicibacter sp. JL.03c TaxID=2984842 RepID=UPI0021F7B6B8|nr:TetR family transcriptional regulator [Glutamicibacter sp. JL.03c]UYQ77487.1 TetR family transcriptional regulator [Glutamicibacter sp. JL.03c]
MGSVVRDRVREKMKTELAQQVYAVFAERGLENVTAQQAAQAVGISRATFFRYFSSKEDAVVTALRSMNMHFSQMLESMASNPSESLLELLRRSFEPTVVAAEEDPEAMRSRVQLVWSTPALRASWQESRREQQAELAQALQPFCANHRLADTSALLALTLYDHALVRWVDSRDESLRGILDEAFDFAAMIDDKWGAARS